jgi:hypothetical protein
MSMMSRSIGYKICTKRQYVHEAHTYDVARR